MEVAQRFRGFWAKDVKGRGHQVQMCVQSAASLGALVHIQDSGSGPCPHAYQLLGHALVPPWGSPAIQTSKESGRDHLCLQPFRRPIQHAKKTFAQGALPAGESTSDLLKLLQPLDRVWFRLELHRTHAHPRARGTTVCPMVQKRLRSRLVFTAALAQPAVPPAMLWPSPSVGPVKSLRFPTSISHPCLCCLP